ncbi:hypothetical protein [Kitasatospora sp. NPDC059327]|uniref:hypothetical protein n=1 Tax=Kitasatospora sp. NPDC059327 TaxID=3346803 RepID=UPI0036C35333
MTVAESATWSPYTCVGNNLGQEYAGGRNDDVASATALRWERAVTAGGARPVRGVSDGRAW